MPKLLPSAVPVFTLLTVSIVAAAEPLGRITGRVTVEQTGAPVAGARVMAITGMSADRPGRQYAHTEIHTSDNGEYELQVPIGNVQLFPPEPPAGYWIGRKPGFPFEEFVVTRNAPFAHHDFQVQQAVRWNARVTTSAGKPVTNVETYVFRDTDIAQAKAAVNGQGEGYFTVPTDGGKLNLGIIDMNFHFFSPRRVALEIASEFDPSTAKIATDDADKPVELIDRAGHKATIDGAKVLVQNGAPQVQLVADELGPECFGELRGQVVDAKAQPIKDATVLLIGSLAPPADLCRTDAAGRFQFRGPIQWMPQQNQPASYELMVLKDGFTGLQTKGQIFRPDGHGVQQLDKPLVLEPGFSAPLRILDADGNPADGAWIEPNGDLSQRAQFVKTNQDGLCRVQNLPAGVTRLGIRYGEQWASEKIVVSASSASEPPVTFRLSKKPSDSAQPEPFEVKPVKSGEAAPDWSTSEWTDGKPHKLADYRGQVVVINFWGVWCSACVNEISVMKQLQEKFAGRAVFVGIHTAGGDINQAKKLLELKQWNLPVGLDKGPEIIKGETTGHYGIRGYPTTIVVDAQGKIAFRSDLDMGNADKDKFMAIVQSLAEELNIPWPIDKDVSEEEAISRLHRMQEHLFTKEIEKAIAGTASVHH